MTTTMKDIANMDNATNMTVNDITLCFNSISASVNILRSTSSHSDDEILNALSFLQRSNIIIFDSPEQLLEYVTKHGLEIHDSELTSPLSPTFDECITNSQLNIVSPISEIYNILAKQFSEKLARIYSNNLLNKVSFYAQIHFLNLKHPNSCLTDRSAILNCLSKIFSFHETESHLLICRKPLAIHLDDEGFLHYTDGGMALQFADNSGGYYCHGVEIPKEFGQVPLSEWAYPLATSFYKPVVSQTIIKEIIRHINRTAK